ncbi:MAG: aminopeptidase [Treponema sp.]|jgi:predicted aminopeptidase|nr:aminopeptidase [Treponema sp.]
MQMFLEKIKFLVLVSLVASFFVVCWVFSGCYTVKQGVTMLGYLCRAVPLEDTDDEDFIRLVGEIRAFAGEELGLTMSKSYTRIVELNRDYLAAVVSASAKDSFRRHEWLYLIVGRLPYKGFFNVDGARKEQRRLEKRDLDVWVRPVDAFSTLGWFNDPLFSFMRNYPPERLAELIIHELVHATVFIKGQIQFNEELAQFTGTEGARLFMEKRYGLDSQEYQKMLTGITDSQNFVNFVQELIAELDELYSSDVGRAKILLEKERIINAFKERFDFEYENLFTSEKYREFLDLPVNNAYFELFRLYHAEDDFFELLYERSGSDLPAFIAAAKAVTRRGGDPRVQLENALIIFSHKE